MNFAYFVPLNMPLKPEDVIKTGLGDVLRDRLTNTDLSGLGRLSVASVSNGPGGHNGTFLQCRSEAADDEDAEPVAVGYFPKTQTWEQAGGYWLGYDPAHLPGPDDLRRDRVIDSYPMTLEDGRDWLCPVIRLADNKTTLPDVWRLKDGKFQSVVKPDWEWAWELTGELWDRWFLFDGEVPQDLAFQWCSKLLGINYRVGPYEAGILGLFGSVSYPAVLRAAINGPIIEYMREQQKKSITPDADSVTSCVGAGA